MQPDPFVYQAWPMRVRFGPGSLSRLPEELDHLDLSSVLVICSPSQRATADRVAASLGDRCAAVQAEVRMHVPVEVAERARAEATRLGVDGLVTIGGGSAVGLGKAIALTTGQPIIAVPTTYAGSEMTPLWGLTEDGAKRTGRDPRVLPSSVIYDADLTLDLPVPVSVTSGMNALAHAVESLYAPDGSPMVRLMAEEGISSLVDALPKIVAAQRDPLGRALAQYGGWLCGACLGATTMSLHHKICHTLGGMFDLPHAATHAVVLPYVMAYNLPAVPAVRATLARLLDAPDPALAVWEIGGRLGAPRSLHALGLAESAIAAAAEQVTAAPYATPREATADAVHALLRRAWSGEPPSYSSDAAAT